MFCIRYLPAQEAQWTGQQAVSLMDWPQTQYPERSLSLSLHTSGSLLVMSIQTCDNAEASFSSSV